MDKQAIWTIVIQVIGSGAFTAIVNFILNRFAYKSQIAAGLKDILSIKIKELAKQYIQQGEVTQEDLQDLERLYDSYHALGGNGFLDNLMNAVRKLKIIA